MTFDHNRLEELFDKYVRGTITAEEFDEFWRLVKDGHANGTLSAKVTLLWQEWVDKTKPGTGPDKSKVFSRIMEKGKDREIDFEKIHSVPFFQQRRVVSAAAALGVIVAGIYLLRDRKSVV